MSEKHLKARGLDLGILQSILRAFDLQKLSPIEMLFIVVVW